MGFVEAELTDKMAGENHFPQPLRNHIGMQPEPSSQMEKGEHLQWQGEVTGYGQRSSSGIFCAPDGLALVSAPESLPSFIGLMTESEGEFIKGTE